MFQGIKLCLLFTSLMTETWSFLAFQTSGMLGQSQGRQSQELVFPVMAKNTLTAGQMLAQPSNRPPPRDAWDLAGVGIGGDSLFNGYGADRSPSFGFNLGFGVQPPASVNPVIVNNALNTGKKLVQPGKQELSDLAGVQIGADLLFGGYGTEKRPSLGFSLGSTTPQKSSPSVSIQVAKKPSLAAFNLGFGSKSELISQPHTLKVPLSLEIAATPEVSSPPSIHPPPYEGTYNPLAKDDFHLAFSILNPILESKKTSDPIMYPVQFYSPEALKLANFQGEPEGITSVHNSNYDNFDAW